MRPHIEQRWHFGVTDVVQTSRHNQASERTDASAGRHLPCHQTLSRPHVMLHTSLHHAAIVNQGVCRFRYVYLINSWALKDFEILSYGHANLNAHGHEEQPVIILSLSSFFDSISWLPLHLASTKFSFNPLLSALKVAQDDVECRFPARQISL